MHDEVAARDRAAALAFVDGVRGAYATVVACYDSDQLAELSDGLAVDTHEILDQQQKLDRVVEESNRQVVRMIELVNRWMEFQQVGCSLSVEEIVEEQL